MSDEIEELCYVPQFIADKHGIGIVEAHCSSFGDPRACAYHFNVTMG